MVIQGKIDYFPPVVGPEGRGVKDGDGPYPVLSPFEGIPELGDAVSHSTHDPQTSNDHSPFGFHGISVPVIGIAPPINGLYFIGSTYNVQILPRKSTVISFAGVSVIFGENHGPGA